MVKTMKMMVTGGGIVYVRGGSGSGSGGGFMYVRGGRTQGEDIASGDLQPRFCAREDFATIGKNPREHFGNTSFASEAE